jgi:hypothetical protein
LVVPDTNRRGFRGGAAEEHLAAASAPKELVEPIEHPVGCLHRFDLGVAGVREPAEDVHIATVRSAAGIARDGIELDQTSGRTGLHFR